MEMRSIVTQTNTKEESDIISFIQHTLTTSGLTEFSSSLKIESQYSFDFMKGSFTNKTQYFISLDDVDCLTISNITNLENFYATCKKRIAAEEIGKFILNEHLPGYELGDSVPHIEGLKHINGDIRTIKTGLTEGKTHVVILTHPVFYLNYKTQMKELATRLANTAIFHLLLIDIYGEGLLDFDRLIMYGKKDYITENMEFYNYPNNHELKTFLSFHSLYETGLSKWYFLNHSGEVVLFKNSKNPSIEWANEYVEKLKNELPQVERPKKIKEVPESCSSEAILGNEGFEEKIREFRTDPYLRLCSNFNKLELVFSKTFTITANSSRITKLDRVRLFQSKTKKVQDLLNKLTSVLNKEDFSQEVVLTGQELLKSTIEKLLDDFGGIIKTNDLEIKEKYLVDKGSLLRSYEVLIHKVLDKESNIKLSSYDVKNEFISSIKVAPKIAVGSSYIPIEGVKDLRKREVTSIQRNSNEAIVLLIWNSWSGICQPLVTRLNVLARDYLNKGDKRLRFVTVGIDNEDSLNEAIYDKNLKYLENYLLQANSSNQHSEIIQAYGINEVPYLVLVNADGDVTYEGNGAGLKLDKAVERLTSEEEIKRRKRSSIDESSKGTLLHYINKEAINEFYLIYSKVNESINNSYSHLYKVIVSYSYNVDSDLNIHPLKIPRITFEYSLREKEKDIVTKELATSLKLKEIKDNSEIFKNKGEILSLVTISKQDYISKSCVKCSKTVGERGIFYCYWCKISLCFECGSNFDIRGNGVEKFPHNHNLIYVNKDNTLENISFDLNKLGTNLVFESNNERFCLKHEAFCNSCGYGIFGVRYVCLNCYPGHVQKESEELFDLCKRCAEEKIEVTAPNHDPRSHLLLAVQVNTGYFDY